jgi:hypothetical protein
MQVKNDVVFYSDTVTAGATGVETLLTLTRAFGLDATTTGTSHKTSAGGKKLRITALEFYVRGHNTATAQTTLFSLRVNKDGAAIATTTPIIFQQRMSTPATANVVDRVVIPIPDGLDIPGGENVQFCISANSVFVTNAPTLQVTIIGYEC